MSGEIYDKLRESYYITMRGQPCTLIVRTTYRLAASLTRLMYEANNLLREQANFGLKAKIYVIVYLLVCTLRRYS